MMTTNTQPLTLEIRKTVQAPVEKVFKGWTEPDQIRKWFGCDKVASLKVSQDFRIGGEYRMDAQCHDGTPVVVFGTFKEIVKNRKLVYSWTNNSEEHPAHDTLVTVEFIEKGTATEIVLKHTNFGTQAGLEGHSMGWENCLEKFAGLFA